ncbi:MAG: nuclear transport factor 2 family protein [Chitinophagaceae bacterium]|nr:nuclear transport factor 2 family protein [Chitinophagaceae bacterium]
MKYFLILLTVCLCGNAVKAQTAEDSVKTVINNLFTAMKTADPVLLRKCFADSMVLQTISRTKEGQVRIINEKPDSFIDFVSKEKPGDADERITFETVKVDGPLAIAWTPYSFYYKGKFSHCGVNSFQLVRFNGEWKIQYLIDTRRRQGCPE